MQSTNLDEIKAALDPTAQHPCTRVTWGVAQVMAVKHRRGQLLVLFRGLPRWYPVEAVTIERPLICPIGACDIGMRDLELIWYTTPKRCSQGHLVV